MTLERSGTFSIRFFMGNGKLQTAVCSLQFTFEPQEGLPAVSDLQQGFLPQKLYSLAFKGMN